MTIIVDGNVLAQEIKTELKKEVAGLKKAIRLAVVLSYSPPATLSFVRKKEVFGKDIGIEVEIKKSPPEIIASRKQFRKWLADIVHEDKNTGVIIQLPLPEKLDKSRQYFLDSILLEKDADVLSSQALGKFATGQLKIQPPVVAAIDFISQYHRIDFQNKKVVIIGAGTLVGRPVSLWLLAQHLPFSLLTRSSQNFKEEVAGADIIISGAGQAGLINKDMVKDGVIIFDAGTSGEQGQIKGDCHPEVIQKAALFTPVPGGIGPLTVAMLFKNLITLAKQ